MNSPDQSWNTQSNPDPQVLPQTHLTRLRSNENYFAANKNFVIKGDKSFFSNLLLTASKNLIFELDDLNAFLFDSEAFTLGYHYLNAFYANKMASSGTNTNNTTLNNLNLANSAGLNKIKMENYIKTQTLVNRFIPLQAQNTTNNPRMTSEWLFELYLIYKIDESFEAKLSDPNQVDENIGSYYSNSSINNKNSTVNNKTEIIGLDKLFTLSEMINDKKSFDFENFQSDKEYNKVNFNILFGDPYDINIRYDPQFEYLAKEKLAKGSSNSLIKSACFDISSLNLQSGILHSKKILYIFSNSFAINMRKLCFY